MRLFIARIRLRDGTRIALTILAASSCAAILIAQDTYGEALQVCSARPA
jgi:hypothetical protein